MANYRLTIAYDGSRYNGWQKQGNTDKTIQGKIEAVINAYEGADGSIEINGAGRTDAGVHAKGQIANVQLSKSGCANRLREYLNEYLPEDIRILQVEEVAERFHARLSAKGKHYRYSICNSPVSADVFGRKYEEYIKDKLDVDRMREATEYFLGEHDFSSFCSNKHMKKSKVRTITKIDISVLGDKLEIDFYGDGFLYNMVRIMTGTLIEVGLGKRNPSDMRGILEAKDRQAAGATAAAKGLCLMEVYY
ncbi:MAG: tRNA pseudouridine(38-40) synthase TruA [Lachnospiraceae bacterium]|nr:tRNA pseudouridine(38-40) synthase TruA [Lachnospiraceae bacterium]